ncbi:hypothetical protein FAM09_10740 [Niastella caeni]|uniref:Glycosyl transferase family 51 domain-containing protein n=1 Tax=Niastella caeni TaxID=2569763 RepID=A0A4V4H1G5_9BACT|nr:biosynthetic peptidoglycan transglycosylase [Niastella caeni]THU40336.1 hypothetical protein FAM09_10740 [Niastella caeni]
MKNLFIIIVTTFFKRIRWIDKIRNNNINRLFLRYNIRLQVQQVKIKGLARYEIRNITIKRSVVEIEIRRLELFLNFWTLIKERTLKNAIKVQLDKLEITCRSLSKDAISANDPVSSNTKKVREEWERELYPKYEKFINAFFLFFPERLMIREVKIRFPQLEIVVAGSILSVSNNLIKADLETSFKKNINKYLVEVAVNKSEKSVIVTIDSNDLPVSNCPAPFSFTHLNFSFTQNDTDQKRKAIRGECRITDLCIHHPAIGATPLLINNFDVEVHINFTPTSFVVTKESGGNINQIPFAFQFSHDTGEKDFLRLVFHVEIDVELFKNSFPAFHNKAIRSITTEGTLLVRFRLIFSMSDPLQHFFDINILKNDLIIKDYGGFDLSYLDKPFVHKIYKDHVFLREIIVGDPHSNFMEIEHFQDKLLSIIIVCEDPNFYYHQGIDVLAIGRAIVSNMIAKKFKRGGSTITMQLARNLFLNHEKNIYRKVEEIILSLLIENYFKISKSRLLEIYVNIIEFGPNVYGIKEAAMFYFKKSPLDLSMIEFIIMMYIIPRPIHFYEALVAQSAQLFTNLKKYVQWLTNGLMTRGIITNEESGKILHDIEIICQSGSIILTNYNYDNVQMQ